MLLKNLMIRAHGNTVGSRTPDVRKTPIPIYETNDIPLYKGPNPRAPDPCTPDPHTLDSRIMDKLSGIQGLCPI